jgi:phage terminase large subunit
MELQIKTTGVFTRNHLALEDKSLRFIINQGGSRSSKTYSLCQLLIVYCLQNPNKVVSVIRKSFPSLRATVYRDMIEVLRELNLYQEKYHNKTEHIYTFPNGSQIEFFSLDDSQKVRGRKRDILFCNESNEIGYEEFMQLNMRTTEKVFCDFNPSDTLHWLYDLIERSDAIKIHSTYKDNPFLEKSIIKEIEELIKVDQDFYNIYALGLPSKSNHTVYNHQTFYLDKPSTKETILGLDFGFQHPTALVRCDFNDNDNEVYVEELLYESHLTTPELINKMKEILTKQGLSMNTTIVCDYARPEIIADLNSNGFNCVNAIKNVKEGIDAVKSKILMVHEDSINIKKELNNYKWKVINERITDEVVKLWDDAMDSMRYAILYYKKNYAAGGGYDFISISF